MTRAVEHASSDNRRPHLLLTSGLIAFFLLLTFDGALRKWFLPSIQSIILPIKDALLFGLLLLAVVYPATRLQRAAVPRAFVAVMTCYAVWALFGMFNPHLPNMLVGLWGAKAHLLYAALVLLVPAVIRDLTSAWHVLRVGYPILAIPVAVIGLLQVNLPSEHILNIQIGDDAAAAAFFGDDNLLRVSGTFSYLSGMGAFVQVMALLGIGLFVAGLRTPVFLVALLLILASLPVAGSRAVIVTTAFGAVAMLCGGVAVRAVTMRRFVGLSIALAAGVALVIYAQSDAWIAIQQRDEANRDEGRGRILINALSLFEYWGLAGMTGFGSGAANLGAVALAPDVPPFSWLPPKTAFEEEGARIVLELGIVGALLNLALRLQVLLWCTTLMLRGRTRAIRIVAVMVLPFLLTSLFLGNGVFAASYAAVSFWFGASLLALAEAEQRRHVPAGVRACTTPIGTMPVRTRTATRGRAAP